MKQLCPSLVLLVAFTFVGCVATIDSSAAPQSNDDAGPGGEAGSAGKATKPAANGGDGGGGATKPGAGAGKPTSTYDDDDAGAPVSKPDAAAPAGSGAAAGGGGGGGGADAGRAGAGAGAADAGGADAGGTTSPVADAAPACDFKGLVMTRCGGSGCHGGPSAGSGLDLTSASLPMRVQGRKGPAACSSNLLIDKGAPEKSALYLKVTGQTCGTQMPLGGGTLPKSDQDCILSWIEGLP